jgi:hypothetical protein
MKFEVSAACHFYEKGDEQVPLLKELGFDFESSYNGRELYLKREDVFVDINTLDELMAFINKYGDIVINKDVIIIYNDYIE